MFVLGVDPGLSRCGYGLVETAPNAVGRPGSSRTPGALRAVAAGVIETPPDAPLPERLHLLRDELRSLISAHRPAVVAVERVFFQVNARTAMSVGQASGLALVEASAAGCAVAQYSANEVKQALVGYGAATKEQVQRMVAHVLGVRSIPGPPDVADALALAICHLSSEPLRRAVIAASSTGTPSTAGTASVNEGRLRAGAAP